MNRLFVFSLALASTTLACSVNLDGETPGETGRASFSLRSGTCLVFGCGLDRSVLAGAKMDLRVAGLDPAARCVVRSASPAIARVAEPQRACRCSSTGLLDDPEAACPSGETKTCEITVTLDSSAAGDARIEVRDDKDALVDAASVRFAAADRIESKVVRDGADLHAAPDGVYEVPAAAHFGIDSVAFAGSTQLELGQRGFRIAYTNPDVVRAETGFVIDGASTESAEAAAPGGASVRVETLGGAKQEIRLRVTR